MLIVWSQCSYALQKIFSELHYFKETGCQSNRKEIKCSVNANYVYQIVKFMHKQNQALVIVCRGINFIFLNYQLKIRKWLFSVNFILLISFICHILKKTNSISCQYQLFLDLHIGAKLSSTYIMWNQSSSLHILAQEWEKYWIYQTSVNLIALKGYLNISH